MHRIPTRLDRAERTANVSFKGLPALDSAAETRSWKRPADMDNLHERGAAWKMRMV